ncbi:MAG: SDR family NAD(P)-dependent oxidoreductase, partial [Longimicrobiales bacterium]
LQLRDAGVRRMREGRVAVAMLVGAAAGVLLAATVLIPNFEPPGIFLAAAALLAMFGTIEANRPHLNAARETMDMNGKVVLITGVGDRGQLGWAIARRFLGAGARVAITNRSGDLAALAAELGPPPAVLGVNADLTADDDIARLFGAIRERFGRLDALVHAAGGLSVTKPVAETDPVEWRRELERNADTTFRISRAALPLLRESRGALVHFASPAGLRAVASLGAYSAAKAAVIALTRAIALEEKRHGVRANAIAPGMIDTEQNRSTATPDTRYVTRDQVAEVALFLASESGSGMSGETVRVMGDSLS